MKPETLFGADIGADAVGASEVAPGAIGSAEILDGAVGTGDLSAAPAARVTGTVASVPPNNAIFDEVAFSNDSTGDAYDPTDMWSPAAPDRFTVQIAGVYVATASVVWPNDFTSNPMATLQDQGNRLVQISGSSGENQRSVMGPSRFGTETTFQGAAAILRLEAGDTIVTQVAQDNEDDSALTNLSVQMAAAWIGPAP